MKEAFPNLTTCKNIPAVYLDRNSVEIVWRAARGGRKACLVRIPRDMLVDIMAYSLTARTKCLLYDVHWTSGQNKNVMTQNTCYRLPLQVLHHQLSHVRNHDHGKRAISAFGVKKTNEGLSYKTKGLCCPYFFFGEIAGTYRGTYFSRGNIILATWPMVVSGCCLGCCSGVSIWCL